MTITQITQALGEWSIRLRADTPRTVLDALTYFGHVAIAPGRLPVAQYGDNLLTAARYVGVLRRQDQRDEQTLTGAGMAFWLGDEDNKGDVYENAVAPASASFANTVRALLPTHGSVTEGTLYSVAGTYTGTHRWQSPREAITYVCGIFSTSTNPVEWRVNGNGTLDAGLVSQLYVTTPKVLLVERNAGRELQRVALAGNLELINDVEDYSTRVVVLAQGEGDAVATGAASLSVVPYRDIHGNVLRLTRLVSSAETTASNAAAVAQLQLNRFSAPRYGVMLSANAYDITGDLVLGDAVAVYDPSNGFIDTANEQYWRGVPVNPIYLRVVEMTWPVPGGWTVAYRSNTGQWLDLSDYYEPEGGDTRIVVGQFDRSLTGITTQPIGTRPVGDSSVPAAPTFTGFTTGVYQQATATDTGLTKAAIRAQWTTPLNVDGSTVLDGDRYEIRYRVNAVIGYQVDWDTLTTYTWDGLGTWDALVSNPVQASPQWLTAVVGFGTNAFTILELSPGVQYELQIRAVDSASPPNFGAFSASSFVTTLGDVIAPSAPAAPEVAGSRVSIQVVHRLGKNSGGTFNLEPDLDHLNVHVGGSTSFYPDETNQVGKLIATVGMLSGSVPAVGSFNVEQVDGIYVKVVAVDVAGNKSTASPAATVTALLIDDAHISDLTATKITAGTINTGTIDVASQIRVATGGTVDVTNGAFRVLNPSGGVILKAGVISGRTCLEIYDASGNVKNRMGQLTDGTYGVESENQSGHLVSLETLAFGIRAAQVNVIETTTSGSYTDLSTVGPSVAVQLGASARCIVFLSAELYTGQSGGFPGSPGAFMSFQVADSGGAVVLSAQDGNALKFNLDKNNQSAGETVTGSARIGCTVFLDSTSGLAQGTYTFTCKYRRFSSVGGEAEFDQRSIVVFPY
jgi:hypothetical protein